MVGIAQLVRALVCGTRGRGFKSHYPPKVKGLAQARPFFVACLLGIKLIYIL